tara:strand:+ start:641 stop:3028 length:2388 start_codon:yes stop_codon:yes gene_type:complete
MKNKFIFFLAACLFININYYDIKAEEFTFESQSIEITNNGNKIQAKDGVKVSTTNNIEITANESTYNKIKLILSLTGNIKVIDKENNIKIEGENIVYYKNKEEIISKGNTTIHINNEYVINTSDIIYSKKENIIHSKSQATLEDNFENKFSVENFTFSVLDKIFKSEKINLLDSEKNKYSFNESMVNIKSNEIIGKDIKIDFRNDIFGNDKNDPRLRGNYASSNKEETIIKSGIFTTCKKNNKCPPWTVKADEIQHDKKNKIINYKNAWLQIYDQPVFYFPKFFHPDPTVKRQSGFLIPKMGSSSVSGSSLQVPYYHVIADNKDFTFNPNIYFNGDILLQNEYRQANKNSDHISDFSVSKSKSSTKSHLFSNTKMNLETNIFENSDLEFNIEHSTHDTYLKNYKISSSINDNPSLLNSFVDFNASKGDLSIATRFEVFEDLSKNRSDRYQYVYPDFTITKLINTEIDLKGELSFSASGSQKNYNTNVYESVLINDFSYNSIPFFLKNGITNNLKFLFKNVNTKGEKSSNYKNELSSENFGAFSFNSSFPLKKSGKNINSYFTPKASFRFSPNKSRNQKDSDRRIDFNNIFSLNRLAVSDSVEGGQALTIGSEYILKKKNNDQLLSLNLATNFKDVNDSRLPTKSKLGNKSSDIVGALELSPSEYFNLNYDFSLDNNLKTSNYNLAKSTITINNFVTSFEFLEENNELGSESYLTNDIGYEFNESNKLKFRTRKNKKTNLTEFYNLIYEYKNDCLVAAVEYNKDYYSDRDIKPNEELFFSLTIVPLGTFFTPNTKQ